MSYLIQRDYDRVIQDAELQQMLNTDAGIQAMAERTALAKVKAYLKQKYYTDWEFTDTDVFSGSAAYAGNNRVVLDFAAYVPANTYNVGDLVSSGTKQYCCKTAATTGPFDASKFYLLGEQYDIWYLALPAALFNLQQGKYKVNDLVYWPTTAKVYQAAKGSPLLTELDRLEPIYDQNVPYPNVFPDDPLQGANFWGAGAAYAITGIVPGVPLTAYTAWSAGTYAQGDIRTYGGVLYVSQASTNTSIPGTDLKWLPVTWTSGDNRDQMILDVLLAMVIWDITSRIMADNSPEVRKVARDAAIQTLEDFAHGKITPDKLEAYQTGEGLTTTYGGVTKTINTW